MKHEEQTGMVVEKIGLIVNPKWPWLGASHDGILKRNGHVIEIEVKCPVSKRNMSIKDACQDKNFCLTYENDKARLKQTYNYFYQCQGIMAVANMKKIDFIVLTIVDMHIETITFQKD